MMLLRLHNGAWNGVPGYLIGSMDDTLALGRLCRYSKLIFHLYQMQAAHCTLVLSNIVMSLIHNIIPSLQHRNIIKINLAHPNPSNNTKLQLPL